MARSEPVPAGIAQARNRSGPDAIEAHLRACDAAFSTPLSLRVPIVDYAARLAAYAERFEAWAGSDLIGLAALYCNARDRQTAFLTNLSVVPAWTRRGIARALLGEAIRHAREQGFARMELSVERRAPALVLYRSLGFRGDARADGTLSLSLALLGEAGPQAR